MDQQKRENLLQFIDRVLEGGEAHIKITFFEREDDRTKAHLVSQIFNEMTGAEIVEMPGKYFTAKVGKVEFNHYYFGSGPIVIKI